MIQKKGRIMNLRWQRRGLAAFAGPLLLLSTAILSATLGASCENTTAEKRVSLATRIVADDAVNAPIVNAYGWSIVVTRAALSIGPLYYWNGAPAYTATNTHDPLRFFRMPLAHAHPGHYVPGDAMGQALTPSSVDLALGEATLPPGEGVSGVYGSGRFTFTDKPVGDAVDALAGNVVVVEGEGTKGAMQRIFRAELDIADTLDAAGEPRIDGCAFDGEPNVQADGTITIHVALSVWLDQVELDALPESADGKPVLLPRDSAAFRAIERGIKKAPAIQFQYTTP
jgi:hypothetical protein